MVRLCGAGGSSLLAPPEHNQGLERPQPNRYPAPDGDRGVTGAEATRTPGPCRPRLGASLLAILAALAMLVSACGSSTSRVAATPSTGPLQTGTLTADGVQRSFRVYAPPATARAGAVPLVLLLHGGNQNAQDMEALTQFDAQADAGRFIVAYPNGHGETWNAGRCCGHPNVSTSNEVAFIDSLITRIEGEHQVDPARVYVAGFSAGAAMSYTLACRLANRITAIASVAGTLAIDICQPQRPVSVMEIHGTTDPELPIEGGRRADGGTTPSIPSVLARWATLDGCQRAVAPSGNSPVQVTRWSGCSQGTSVVLETIAGAHHTWYAPGLGAGDGALDASQTVWQFFSPLRR